MQTPSKITDGWPIKVVHDPATSTSVTYASAGYLVLPTLMFGAIAATLWSITAVVYWFVWIAGLIF